MSKTYKGKYKVRNPSKYKGDHTNVIYRSLWERQVFRWCEANADVVWWNSESLVIPYRCATDGKIHRYYVDVQLRLKDGKTYCIEIKPKAQTMPPTSKRKSPRLLKETLTYAKNTSKWKAAASYCSQRGMIFTVWTEDTLKSLGIKILT